MTLNENVKKLLKEQMWYLATYSDEPNVVPVAFKDITADGKLVVGDVFMDTTLKNVKLNGKSYSYNTGTGQQKRTLIKYIKKSHPIKITIRLLINSQTPNLFIKSIFLNYF